MNKLEKLKTYLRGRGKVAVAYSGDASGIKQIVFKAEIRALSKTMNLPTWSKPSMACLASRFVYGESLMPERLATVEAAEDFLRGLGFIQLRVRVHGNLARLEVLPEDFPKLMTLREAVVDKLTALGFAYVTLDLRGYRVGSMNLFTSASA